MGTRLPSKRAQPPPNFRPYVCCCQTAGWIKMPLGTEVGLGPCDVVLDGDPAPPKRGTAPQFSANVCCGQTAGWMKMPLGTEVDLDPGTLCYTGTQLPLDLQAQQPPLFGAYCGHGRASQLLLSSCAQMIASVPCCTYFLNCMHVDPGGGLQVSDKASSRSPPPESTAVGVHNAKIPGLLVDHFGDPGRANGRGVCVLSNMGVHHYRYVALCFLNIRQGSVMSCLPGFWQFQAK